MDFKSRAQQILHETYGPESKFRAGQLEAILAVVNKQKTLVIQKTGWGKSIVYFIATKLLRENGSGPAVIISPLLALMHNQIDAATGLGLDVITINSNNRDEWDDLYARLHNVDAIIISPEKLSDPRFIEALSQVNDIELIVVDEAHSISDWGHDFRPDYQRIVNLVKALPDNVAILGTTATANDRVIEDIKSQLGNVQVFRGNLIRSNISIQVNPSQSKAERLAFLAANLIEHPFLSKEQGIVYCLTKKECESVANFLCEQGISAAAYYSGMKDEFGEDTSVTTLEQFHEGNIRVIVATVKLGMGYDKSNIGFVVHFQLPQNLIAYYQQIGRAGRDGKPSLALLLHGDEDDAIIQSFIDSANKDPKLLTEMLDKIRSNPDGMSRNDLLPYFNLNVTKLSGVLKYLFVHEYILLNKRKYVINPDKPFNAVSNAALQHQLNQTRLQELDHLKRFVNYDGCYMKFIADELDAPDVTERCGICAHCRNRQFISLSPDHPMIQVAMDYKNKLHGEITPRKRWSNNKKIDESLQFEKGWTYTSDAYSPVGRKLMYERDNNHYSEQTTLQMSQFLKDIITQHHIDAVVAVPSLRRPHLTTKLAKAIAAYNHIQFIDAVIKTSEGNRQSDMHNAIMQQQNIETTIALQHEDQLTQKNILLIDDTVNSKWTMTVIAAQLLEHAQHVYPFALVNTGASD
ncbi:RecQ family ATP-dependent DNA helicase [Macrococcus capreoli]|uniref:RecQ family ATP-dependent DNA helicase n=1 Tax=Macrococcus capreoli TaxID=2982690 RepID=UPI0021D5B046|nr:RecQ family ATP-dependent DNA helicase [Macrococcus sp. TMW 2.2395]MCU7556158.1 RecQ family ATP-dependent DNA helicase [Macrococcus sp. TMW 2.2395]